MISTQGFAAVSDLFHRVSGIRLTEAKRALVTGRLQKLAQARGIGDVDAYVQQLLADKDPQTLEQVVDKLTTNETYFFREPEHFAFLERRIAGRRANPAAPLRVWSAASSSGEEAYSIAMLLADKLGLQGWEVVGTDLSTTVLDAACRGLYTLERARKLPPAYLQRWCRKGQGSYSGMLLVARELRERVHFGQANLMQPLPDIGPFDVIFLRNVLIYFDPPAKEAIVRRVLGQLADGGVLFTGHAESLNGPALGLRSVQPAVYQRA